MLEELPAGKHATVFVEIQDEVEKQDLQSKARLELAWLSRGGLPAGSTTLLPDALRSLDPLTDDGSTFVWAGCEHAAARAIRSQLWEGRRLPKQSALVMAYWRLGTAGEVD
jgi:NADPH-dependent ferric siderophore reductase